MDVWLIAVPSHAGDDRHPSSEGPRRLVEEAAPQLARRGHRVVVTSVDRGRAFRDTTSSSADVNRQVARLVAEAITSGRFPLVLAGSCVTSHAVLAGFDHSRCGVVWIDAHADFNTPDTSVSGFFPGMSMAVLAGHCFAPYWATIGHSTPVAEEKVVLFGTRDLSPEAERQRLQDSGIQVVEWRGGRPQRGIVEVLDRLSERVRSVYLHIDLDGFAPEVAPGVVDEPVPGGLSTEDGERILRETVSRFRVKAATLATLNPARDRGDKTLRLALRLIEVLVDCV